MKRWKKIVLACTIIPAGISVLIAAATEHTVSQKDRDFSTKEMTITVGDSVKFTNEDNIVHDVFSSTPGMEFDLKTQQPNSSSTIKFDKEGVCEVRCAIHPKMKLKITVQKAN